jgi:hypothetical protein
MGLTDGFISQLFITFILRGENFVFYAYIIHLLF